MAISANQIVSVVPRVINAGASELEITGLLLTENELCPFPKTITFSTAKGVGDYFGLDSKEYRMADKYFLGYDNSFKKPSQITFGRLVKNSIPATYIGTGAVAKLSELRVIGNGAFVISVNGVQKTVVGLNFNNITTESDVAELLSNEIASASVKYNSNLREYVVISNSSGDGSKIEFIADGGDVEALKKFKLTDSAISGGYSVDNDGLWQGTEERSFVADWKQISAEWENTYKTLFEEAEDGDVSQYKYYDYVGVCYGSAEAFDAVLDKLGLDSGTVWEGASAKAPSVNMDFIVDYNKNWVSFTTINEVDTDIAVGFSEWVNGKQCEYLYVPYTTKVEDINPMATENMPNTLGKYNFEGVYLVWGDTEYAVFVMSVGACIDWNRNNGIPTWKFLRQSGLLPNVEDDTTYLNCKTLKVNPYGNFATRNDNFEFHCEGQMMGGNYGFIDAYISQLWLRNVLQVSLVNGMLNAGRVGYRGAGYTRIRSWCQDPIDRALSNGAIASGVKLSETQKAQIYSEVGADVSDEIYLNGYYLKIADPGAQARVKRETPELGLWYTYDGAVHRIELPVTVVL